MMESPNTTNGVQTGNLKQGATLTWNDVSVWHRKRIPTSFWKKQEYDNIQILKNVSGIAKSGNLLAIMGASGAGKTTLLATISLRIKGEIEGEILINGKLVDQNIMSNMSGFVPQKDLTINNLTVLEHMLFMASMKMDLSVTRLQRQKHICSLLSELGLRKCEHTSLSSLSGGEEKRLSLAVQLLTDPPFLFCDEPTTGLDSYNASIVIEKLKHLAKCGKAIICTIHQPASDLFDMFSHMLILAKGRVAFFGKTIYVADYFESLNFVCPKTFNKAEFYISQPAIISGREEESNRKIKWICDSYDTSMFSIELAEEIARINRQLNIFQIQPFHMRLPSTVRKIDKVL